MGNYTIFQMFENPRRGRQARNLQQIFRKFQISNRLPNRYFPKLDDGCPCTLKGLRSDKPSHKRDPNKYQTKAFGPFVIRSDQICNARKQNIPGLIYVCIDRYSINTTSTAPISSCVHGRTQFFKIVGLRSSVSFSSLPLPVIPFFFLLLSQLSRRPRAETVATQASQKILLLSGSAFLSILQSACETGIKRWQF